MNNHTKDETLQHLTKTIEYKRQSLIELVNKCGNINHPLVLHASEELDYYVLRMQRIKMKVSSKAGMQ